MSDLVGFSKDYDSSHTDYIENYSSTKLNRTALLHEAEHGDLLLVESVDRLIRLSQDDFAILKQRIKDKGLRLVVADLPTMAKLDNDRRRERIKQGLANSGCKPTGKKANLVKHNRIRELARQNSMTKDEIAKACGIGVVTVCRVLKEAV